MLLDEEDDSGSAKFKASGMDFGSAELFNGRESPRSVSPNATTDVSNREVPRGGDRVFKLVRLRTTGTRSARAAPNVNMSALKMGRLRKEGEKLVHKGSRMKDARPSLANNFIDSDESRCTKSSATDADLGLVELWKADDKSNCALSSVDATSSSQTMLLTAAINIRWTWSAMVGAISECAQAREAVSKPELIMSSTSDMDSVHPAPNTSACILGQVSKRKIRQIPEYERSAMNGANSVRARDLEDKLRPNCTASDAIAGTPKQLKPRKVSSDSKWT